METSKRYNCAAVCTYSLFSDPCYPMVSINFSADDPCCRGNEFWDKIDYNSAPV